MLQLGGKIKGNILDQTDLKNALDNKANTSDIPTKTSELQNDSNFINNTELNTALATKANISDIPTKTSDLQNDSNFINNTELNTALVNYQEKLVSGTNIKTINNESILGSGNIDIQGGEALPVGSEIDYDGTTIPDGWQKVDQVPLYSTTETTCGTWIDRETFI